MDSRYTSCPIFVKFSNVIATDSAVHSLSDCCRGKSSSRQIPLLFHLVSAIQTCNQLLRLGLLSPHREARLRRRELRQRQQAEVDDLADRMKLLQEANENKQRQLEAMREVLRHDQSLKL